MLRLAGNSPAQALKGSETKVEDIHRVIAIHYF